MTDLEIARSHKPKAIVDIAKSYGIDKAALVPYGWNKAKVLVDKLPKRDAKSHIILVSAINPTPFGEGKTTTSIGLADALSAIGKKCALALREPSLGPVFGMKGGACGGGYAQVIPMEDINLHFTGDFHAIAAANNLLAAMLDNHIKQGNSLNIDPRRILWKRALDVNDRQLRHIVSGMGGPVHGVVREDGFDITVASEVMAVFCLAKDLQDLKERLGRMLVAYSYEQKPIYARDLYAEGAMCALLKDAIHPNLVQTLEGTAAFVHGGPFANIAHGCNSIIATKTAASVADYVVTEAGFGADLGAEKYLDIASRTADVWPDATVVVATVRALKYNGGVDKKDLEVENLEALRAGLPNLYRHVENLQKVFGQKVIVAINAFPTDTAAEISCIQDELSDLGVDVVVSKVWAKGSKGGIELAEKLVKLVESDPQTEAKFAYELEASIVDKMRELAINIYHADDVSFSQKALKEAARLEDLGYGDLPLCVAKTQYSFSDDPKKLAAPTHFEMHVRDLRVSAGAGFIVMLCGDIMTMPGLPKVPAAEAIDVNDEGEIVGLF